MWTCAQRPKKLQRPEDPLQARLGWPTGKAGEDKKDKAILEWFEEVAKETWRQRYHGRGERPDDEVEEAEEEEDEEEAEAEEEEDAESEAEAEAEEERRRKRKKQQDQEEEAEVAKKMRIGPA